MAALEILTADGDTSLCTHLALAEKCNISVEPITTNVDGSYCIGLRPRLLQPVCIRQSKWVHTNPKQS
jgi:hypothetical protein